MAQKYINPIENTSAVQSRFCSVLDTIGTLPHFLNDKETKKTHSRDFYTTYYRHRNLDTIKALKKSTHVHCKPIEKTIKALACCSHVAAVSNVEGQQMTIQQTSGRCKNRYCQICARIESNVLVNRFLDQVNDEGNKDFFNGKHFYFLTLTLKHDENTRNDIYLNYLRKYVSKLTNSKDFKNIFQIQDKKNDWAAYQSIEMTISKSQYHIHAHMIIVARPLLRKVKDCEDKIRSKWKSITKDSDIIRLDLVKNKIDSQSADNENDLNEAIRAASSELFKYIIKTPDTNKMIESDIDMLANWIIETKGKNFINALGYFRHNSIIKSRIKKNEENKPNDKPDYDRLWIATRKYNYPH
jgi:hypothetical protein